VGRYRLRCLSCGKIFFNDGFRLNCDEAHARSLLRSDFEQKSLKVKTDLPGMFRFSDWLPVRSHLEVKGAPVTYRSNGLAAELGLKNLFISFNGYWPERGALMETCTFKELEAPPTVLRLIENGGGTLVVASAGNTARAFAHICGLNNIPLYLVVPAPAVESIQLSEINAGLIRLIVLGGNCDYADAIQLANRLAETAGLVNEGGVANIARRDGMGTTVIAAVLAIGEIPDHYFQAVGSGSGAIAAWEANLRLIGSGQYGDKKIKLHLSQNHPFTPLYSAWAAGDNRLQTMENEEAKRKINTIAAGVLSNRNPPYSITGGVYAALKDTRGEMYAVTNRELYAAKEVFERLEGIDIHPAAAVAVASLVQALKQEKVEPDDKILLNITGGGDLKLKQTRSLQTLKPDLVLENAQVNIQEILDQLK
jgi:cysteate synthase